MPLKQIDATYTQGTYISFCNLGQLPGKVTNGYGVWTLGPNSAVLGWIKWFPRWRKYAFTSDSPDNVYEEICLREIADFCEQETKAHKAKKKAE